MATTHALAGLVLAVVTLRYAPDAGLLAVAAAGLGGLFPDFDLYFGHRKTLHFPVYYSVTAALAGLVAVVIPGPVTIALALFLAAAALHSVTDVLGGGLELRPWEGTSEEAVYSHYHGRWWRPRRLVRYDGAPEDFLLGLVLALPVLWSLDGSVETVVLAALAVSGVYALLRKPLIRFGEWLFGRLPPKLLDRLPEGMVGDFRETS